MRNEYLSGDALGSIYFATYNLAGPWPPHGGGGHRVWVLFTFLDVDAEETFLHYSLEYWRTLQVCMH